jgi:predicted DNA-binding transcriptional regulator AlpA
MSTTTAAADSTAASPALLSLRTFLKQYSLSKSQFYREAAKGNAPPIVKNGRRTLIPAAEAAAWLAARIVPAQSISQAARGAS